MRFAEYPNGIFIDNDGNILPLNQSQHRKLFLCESDSEDDVVEIPRFIRKKAKIVEDKIACVVCLENPAVGVFTKCKHQCCCMKCGPKLDDLCPICRTTSIFIHHLEIPQDVVIYK